MVVAGGVTEGDEVPGVGGLLRVGGDFGASRRRDRASLVKISNGRAIGLRWRTPGGLGAKGKSGEARRSAIDSAVVRVWRLYRQGNWRSACVTRTVWRRWPPKRPGPLRAGGKWELHWDQGSPCHRESSGWWRQPVANNRTACSPPLIRGGRYLAADHRPVATTTADLLRRNVRQRRQLVEQRLFRSSCLTVIQPNS
jgi:hypothetical protein